MNTFQLIILGIFTFFFLFGFLVFSGFIPFFGGSDVPSGVGGTVTVWGSVSQEFMKEPLRKLNEKNKDTYAVEYREIRAEEFDTVLVEALASGRGPDIVLLPEDLILRHRDKIYPLPYENFSARKFMDTYIEEGELYLGKEGILALPFSINPVVMYWNRDIFSSASIAEPPKRWEQLFGLTSRLTEIDNAFNIRKSAVAFGEFRNVTHAKDILSMLVLQAGNPIVEMVDGALRVVFQDRRGFTTPPSESSLRFYTGFSNSASPIYTWNRALPQSKDFFITGDLAMYFGYAGELDDIRAKSPHLNFDVSLVPQPEGVDRHVTFGKMTGATVLRQSDNITTSFWAILELSGSDFAREFSAESNLPPVQRALLAGPPPNALQNVFYESALISRSWLDPDPGATKNIFQTMVEDIVSGRRKEADAISRAHTELGRLLGAIQAW